MFVRKIMNFIENVERKKKNSYIPKVDNPKLE